MNEVILKEINSYKNKRKAKIFAGFSKTGKGEYGYGNVFLGVAMPVSRKIAERYKNISITKISSLLKNKIHEVRLIALLILVNKYKNSTLKEKKEIVDFYLQNTKYVNDWSLVDLSAPKILGEYLLNKKDKKILLKLAKSKSLWEQRIAIISTFTFIRYGKLDWTFKIAKMFINHKHDLIHKATGWMLREAGKRDVKSLRKFLDANFPHMPRTMLRYAIERFPEDIRLNYLKK